MCKYSDFIDEAIVRARCLIVFNYANAPQIDITYSWSARMTSTAGLAYVDRLHMKFSIILSRQCWETFQRTVFHEIAHIYTNALFPIESKGKPHGPQWAHVMRSLNQVPRRCHTLETNRKKRPRPHKTYCGCSVHMLTNRIFKKVLLGQTRRCKACKGKLVISPPAKQQTVEDVDDAFEDHLDSFSNEY